MRTKLSIKQILLLFLIIVSLFGILNISTVHADDWEEGTGGDADSGIDNAGGGPTYARTGFILCLVGDNGRPILGSKVVFYPYMNAIPGVSNGSLTTEYFDVNATTPGINTPINLIPAFFGSAPGGPLVQAFLMMPCTMGGDGTYSNNAEYIIDNHFGVSMDKLQAYLANNEAYVQITPIFWARLQGATKDSKGDWYIGNAEKWSIANPYKSYISRYTHRVFAQCTTLTEPWWGLTPVTDYKMVGDFYLGSWRPMGLGIGGIKCKSGYQVTITIEDATGACQTQYLSSGHTYNVKSKIGNAVLQSDSGFVSKTFTKANSPTATYADVKSGMTQVGGLVGAGDFDFLSRDGAKALFLHYKGDLPEPVTTDTDLYAWEVSYRLPGEKAGSTTEKRTDKTIEHNSFNEMQSRVEEWQNSKVYEEELVKYTENDRSLRDSHKYKLSQNHGSFENGGIWQLTRGEYIEKWVDKYPDLASRIWDPVDDMIDPNYAYYLCRSHLEGLGIVEDRDNAGLAAQYLSTPNAFVVGYEGQMGADQQANSNMTHTNVAQYSYQYVPTWSGIGAWIKVEKWTRKVEPHTEGCYGDNPDTATVETDYKTCGVDKHYTPWEDKGEIKFTAQASQFYTLTGSYGNHNIDKYKTQVTGTGLSGMAGSESTESTGSLSGKFVKGSTFDYSGGISRAIHGSQFIGTTFKLYGEIPMCFWKDADTYKYTTQSAETVFVWSEYQRSLIPSMVHGFKTGITGGSMTGTGSLATAATGYTAQKVEGLTNAKTIGLTAMGTTFNVATKNKYYFEFCTLGVTTEDEQSTGTAANAAWGNPHTPVGAAHQAYVGSVLAGLNQELIMELTFKTGSTEKGKLYYTLLTDTQGIIKQRTDPKLEYDLYWKNNSFADNGTDYSRFYNPGIAESYLNLQELFDSTLINNGESHDGQLNKSQQSDINLNVVDASGGSYSEYTGYANWYDEESFYRFEVERYDTYIEMDFMSAVDKVDYNLLTQSVLSSYLKQTDYVECRFYTRLWRDTDAPYTDGYYSWASNPTFRVDKVNGVDFSVINQSTEDMKK